MRRTSFVSAAVDAAVPCSRSSVLGRYFISPPLLGLISPGVAFRRIATRGRVGVGIAKRTQC